MPIQIVRKVSVSGGAPLRAANNLGDLTSVPTALAALGIPALRNAFTPRGGVFFDGTSGSNFATTPGAAAAINTDPRAIVWGMRVGPNPGSDAEFARVAETASPTSFYLRLVHGSNGALKIRLFGTSTGEYRETTWAGLSGFANRDIICAFVADSAGRKLYINGVEVTLAADTLTASPPANWQGAIGTGSAGTVRFSGTALVYAVTTATLYNLALSQTDVEEIYFLGGAVPYRFQFGSQTLRYTSNFSAGTDSFAGAVGTEVVDGNIDGIGGEDDVLRTTFAVTGGAGPKRTGGTELVMRKMARISTRVRVPAANVAKTVRITEGSSAAAFGGGADVVLASDTWTTLTYTGQVTGTDLSWMVRVPGGATAGDILYVKSGTVAQVGAVLHLACNEGIGYQLHDVANKLDAVMGLTGVAHLVPRRTGYARTPGSGLSWAGTHEAKNILGVSQRALPPGAAITTATLKSSAGSSGSGATLGTTNSATRWSAAASFTTAKKMLTLANQLPAGSADNDHDILLDPDTANITATVQAEVHYAVTEGTP